jgi:hypothetical protein
MKIKPLELADCGGVASQASWFSFLARHDVFPMAFIIESAARL